MGDDQEIPSEELLFQALKKELTRQCARWLIFKGLYLESPARRELLKHSAAWLFDNLGRILLDDLILGVSRLLDPATTGRFRNLSLERLASSPSIAADSSLSSELQADLGRLRTAAAAILEHRKKRVGHFDADWASGDVTLPEIPFSDFEAALEGASEIMNRVAACYGEPHTLYLHVILPHLEDASGLAWALKKAAVLDEFVVHKHHWTLIQETQFRDA